VQIRCHRKTARAKGGGHAGVHRCHARRVPQPKALIENVSRESNAADYPGQSSRHHLHRIGRAGELREGYADDEVRCGDEEYKVPTPSSGGGLHVRV